MRCGRETAPVSDVRESKPIGEAPTGGEPREIAARLGQLRRGVRRWLAVAGGARVLAAMAGLMALSLAVDRTVRMDRPQMPKDWCPFCPGSGKVPDDYDVHIYPNDFPTFATPPPPADIEGDDLFRTRKSWGACDVVLYHPDHNKTLAELDADHLLKLVELWQSRYLELSAQKKVKFVYIFENNGETIGVTMPHPHGQIYAFPLIPPVVSRELYYSQKHFDKKGTCLHCDIIGR